MKCRARVERETMGTPFEAGGAGTRSAQAPRIRDSKAVVERS